MSESNGTDGGGTPPADKPKAKKQKMVQVYNKHGFRSFHLGGGRKIGPHETGYIPVAMLEKITDRVPFIVRAERGDVP